MSQEISLRVPEADLGIIRELTRVTGVLIMGVFENGDYEFSYPQKHKKVILRAIAGSKIEVIK
jgi:hypothetical protein